MRAASVVVVLALCACGPKPFPDSFLFGASIAGFQVDPGCPTLPASKCVDANSDWYQWVTSKDELADQANIISFEPLAHGPGHWELYEQDFAQAKKDMNLSAMRISLEWSRIFPTATDGLEGDALKAVANAEAIATYHAMFKSLKANGMTPLVTLNHYTLPLWLHDGVACHKDLATCTKRGWLDKERALKEVAKYAGFVAKEFGSEVELWATENEPFAVILPGYLLPSKDRVNPPGLTLRTAEAKAVMTTLIEAHARMFDAVKAADPTSKIGLVYNMVPTKPKDAAVRLDQRAADNIFYLYNTVFLDGVCKGLVDADFDGKADDTTPRADLANRMEWLGLNYYTRLTVKGTPTASFPTLSMLTNFDITDFQLVEDAPEGLTQLLLYVKDRYALPTYVTETGTDSSADASKAGSWLVRYVDATKQAIAQGADVRGFFYWSLMDNYEWNQGMALKFGLYEVPVDDVTKPRKPRSAVADYATITKARDVSKALLQKYTP